MPHPLNRCFIYFFLLCALCNPVFANPSSEISLSANYLFIKHANYNSNNYTLNTEKGWLPGVQVTVSRRVQRLIGTISLEKYTGNTSYKGQATNGPFTSKTNQDLTRISYRLDKKQSKEYFQFYGLLAFQNWNRNILSQDSTSGLDRQYQWLTLEGGMRFEIYSSRSNVIRADIGLSRTLFSKLQLDLSELELGKPLLRLNDKFGASANLGFRHSFSKNNGIDLFVKTSYWQFGTSDTLSIQIDNKPDMLEEPQSQSLSTAIGASYFYEF